MNFIRFLLGNLDPLRARASGSLCCLRSPEFLSLLGDDLWKNDFHTAPLSLWTHVHAVGPRSFTDCTYFFST